MPEERLLEFNVRQGWGPLREFLGVPVPDAPFPRINDTKGLAGACGEVEDQGGDECREGAGVFGGWEQGVFRASGLGSVGQPEHLNGICKESRHGG